MSFHVPNDRRLMTGEWGSSPVEGNNGIFYVPLSPSLLAVCQASDGLGWEHISISLRRGTRKKQIRPVRRCPTWEEMCAIKAVFWDADDVVVQFHPAENDYINLYPYCLHLWRPTTDVIPIPPAYLVGLKKERP
jgi:hypothetical protein